MHLFCEVDYDNSGNLTLDEFHRALRCPRIHKAFSVLGIQPHQSTLVFKTLDVDRNGIVSINEFMTGLTALVGANLEYIGKELNITSLTPTLKARCRQLRWQSSGQLASKCSEYSLSTAHSSTLKSESARVVQARYEHLEERAARHSALAQALHCATAVERS